MLEVIKSDIKRYQQEESSLLSVAIKAAYTHPSSVGLIWYRMGRVSWKRRKHPIWFFLLMLNRVLYPLIRMYSGLELSPRAQIGPGLYIAHFGPTVIHPDTIAGENLTLMQGVTIGATKTGIPQLGNNVSIGTGAQVIGNVKIEDNVTIGSGAVVTKDIQAGLTVVGIPAKPIHT